VKVASSTSQGVWDHGDNDNAVGSGEEAKAHRRCDQGKLDADPIWWLQQSQGPPHLSRLGSRDLPVAKIGKALFFFLEIGHKDCGRGGHWVHIVVRNGPAKPLINGLLSPPDQTTGIVWLIE
jgi:hypothetical protein